VEVFIIISINTNKHTDLILMSYHIAAGRVFANTLNMTVYMIRKIIRKLLLL